MLRQRRMGTVLVLVLVLALVLVLGDEVMLNDGLV
jgi:hypothetical protein